MATNEILFWFLVMMAWALSLMTAYFSGKESAFKHCTKYAQEMADQAIQQRMDELKNQPPIR